MKTKQLIRWSRIAALLGGSLLAGACATEQRDYAFNDSDHYSGTLVRLQPPHIPAVGMGMMGFEGCGPVFRGDTWAPCEF
jgi:hypothetical protein